MHPSWWDVMHHICDASWCITSDVLCDEEVLCFNCIMLLVWCMYHASRYRCAGVMHRDEVVLQRCCAVMKKPCANETWWSFAVSHITSLMCCVIQSHRFVMHPSRMWCEVMKSHHDAMCYALRWSWIIVLVFVGVMHWVVQCDALWYSCIMLLKCCAMKLCCASDTWWSCSVLVISCCDEKVMPSKWIVMHASRLMSSCSTAVMQWNHIASRCSSVWYQWYHTDITDITSRWRNVM